MKNITPFTGFPPELLKYYRDIEKNNNRTWFHSHKDEFKQFVMDPARAFVSEMGVRLSSISPYIYAEPKVNRSIFRIARDVRRNKNKPPYKTQLSLIFWEGGFGRLECPGFYVAIDPKEIHIGAGSYWFPKEGLHEFRDSLVHKKYGKEITHIKKNLGKKGYELKGKHYKRYPRGFSEDDMNADLPLHKSLYIYHTQKHTKILHTPDFVDFIFEKFADGAELHHWLAKMIARAREQKQKRI